MALGATHWNVSPHVRRQANRIVREYGGSWNTYDGHGLPPALGEHWTVDYWGNNGRGDTLAEGRGDRIVKDLLRRRERVPIRIIIWWSWIWTPMAGWQPYSGFQGNHGPGPDAHVHVGYGRP